MSKKILGVVLALMTLLTFATVATAETLYGSNSDGAIVSIDTLTGSATLIGNSGVTAIGMAYNPLTSTMYTRDFSNLYTVNLTTGAVAAVGSSGSEITALAFNPTFSILYSVNQFNGDFYDVDPLTGAATLVGNTGINFPLDLSTNPYTGQLLAATYYGDIYVIDPATGSATLLAANVASTVPGESGFTALSFDSAGNLYGIGLNTDELLKIDLTTGTSTAVGSSTGFGDIRGLDFLRGATPTPEPSSLALIGAGIAGMIGRRIRKSAR